MLRWRKIVDLLVLVSIAYIQQSSADIIPKIIKHPQDVTVAKKSTVELQCLASGKPKPQIHWLRDGKKVPTDDDDPEGRRFVMRTGNLTFMRVIWKKGKTDSGQYQCVAVNKAGTAISNPATLIVGVLRSHFKTEPKDRTVTVGNSVILKCNPPRGKPLPTVSWLKDGVLLQPGGSRVRIVEPGSLYISHAQKLDQGEYVCQATNELGQKRSKSATLTVKELPSTALSIRPKHKVVTAGTNVVFHCEYRDGPQGAIRWNKKGGTLPENRFETSQNGELKIKNTQPGDEGEYICSISSSLSVSAKLIVQIDSSTAASSLSSDSATSVPTLPTAKPYITTRPLDVIVREGAKANFSCQATGNPAPTVFWDRQSTRKPMFAHQDNGRFVVKTTGELIIENVKSEDQGEYVCSALSQAGVSTASTKLTVVGKLDTMPQLVSSPTNQTIQQPQDAIFMCDFNGVPPPTIHWHKDTISSNSLNTSSKYEVIISGYKTQLKIKSGQKGDEGQYICIATNMLGSVLGRAHLIVKSSAKTTLMLPAVVTLRTTTTIPVITPTKQLSPPSELLTGTITTDRVLLLWTSVKPGKLPITYTVEYKKSEKSSRKWTSAADSITANSFFVIGLEPNTLYEFSVRAKTAKSHSKRTIAMYKTKVLKTTRKPVLTKKHNHAKVLVNVEPVEWDKLNITWKFDRHVKRSPSGFHVFWREYDSTDGYEKVLVMGDSIQQHTLKGLSANTSYVIQVQVFFNKHKLPKTKALAAITGAKDNGLVVLINGPGKKQGAESDVKIIQADTRGAGTWARVREFVRKPWFIAIMGGVLWIILLVVALLLYRRRRRNRRQLKQRTLKLQIAEIQRPPTSPQGHKTLWMDDVDTTDPTPPQQPANNRISDTSSTECLNRSVTSCCARRGIISTGDFPNKITLNSLAAARLGDHNQFDVPVDAKVPESKANNVQQQQQSINNYREHLNKSAKFEEAAELASIGSRSGSEATLPRAMPQQTSFLTPTQQFINRKKAHARPDSPASQQKDPNKTPDDASVTEKTKPKLKIQSFDMSSNSSIPGTTTFHADPPPTYEAVLKETEMEKQLGDGQDEEISKSKEELAEKLKATPFSDKPAVRPPSPPLSERSCKTTSSCGSRKRKVLKPPPRLAILNWADLLPPPPSHPPPSSLGSPPPSPPFSLRSGMSGMSGLTGMSGMTGLTGMTGMTGMTGRTGKSSANGTGDSDPPERLRRKPGPPSSAVSDSLASAEPNKVPGSTKSKSSKHKKTKPKAMPIDLEGITSDIIMQWADSVTNTSGSDDDSSCSSPSRVSSTGSFFTDADFANAVRAAAECGGFNMETYGLMDSLGYPPPYSGSWKQGTSVSNGSEPSGPTMNPRPPRGNRNKWETGSEGDVEFTPPVTVRPNFTRKAQQAESGTPPIGPSKMATDMGIRKIARSPVPIVPSQPRRPIPRAARNMSNSPVPGTGQIIVQPLKKTSALSNGDVSNRAPVMKKFAVVKKIPQSKDAEYNSATLSSSGKSSTSTASTVKTSTMGDSDAESAT